MEAIRCNRVLSPVALGRERAKRPFPAYEDEARSVVAVKDAGVWHGSAARSREAA